MAPQINAGLEAQGLTPGTTLYAQFFRDSQTVIDAGDPINYISLATAQHPIHLLQVVGSTPPPASLHCELARQRLPGPGGAEFRDTGPDHRLALRTRAVPAGALTRIAAPAAPGPLLNPNGLPRPT